MCKSSTRGSLYVNKPSFSDQLKISDFGLATIFRHQGQTRKLETCCGTVPYVAPEVSPTGSESNRTGSESVWARDRPEVSPTQPAVSLFGQKADRK